MKKQLGRTAFPLFPRWYISFQVAALQQLPRPGEIDKRTVDWWYKHQEEFKKVLSTLSSIPVITLAASAEEAEEDREEIHSLPTVLKIAFPEAPKPLAPPPEEATQKEGSSDLASELGAALDGLEETETEFFEEEGKTAEELSFEEVFAAFKAGVDKKVDQADYSTHYNLGIAYKEMGLVDEAIGEFQVARCSPDFFLECCVMLGACFRQKGMSKFAEAWYRKGIQAPGFSEDAYIGLRYDLAETLEEQGRHGEARELYGEVFNANASYRDVRKKIKG